MSAGGKCIAKMTVFFNETIPSEVVTCFCTRALLRYGAMLQCSDSNLHLMDVDMCRKTVLLSLKMVSKSHNQQFLRAEREENHFVS